MTRSLALATLFLAAACRSSAPQAPSFDGSQALRWVEHQVAAGPRVPNTTAHRRIGDWLVDELSRRADTVEVQSFVHVSQRGDTLRLRNVLARFRPGDSNRVLYVSHWDSRPVADQDPDPANRERPVPGANDGASSTALLLGVAEALHRTPPGLGVDLLFVDGEDYGDFSGPDVLLGSRHFAANLPAGYRPLFAVVWDMVGDSASRFLREGYSVQASPEVVDRVWRAAEAIGLGRFFRAGNGGAITDDHLPLIEAGIRAIDVIPSPLPPYWHTAADTPDKLAAVAFERVGALALYLLQP
jgi:Zn-dependent M28 family amino/carboxypeptidase